MLFLLTDPLRQLSKSYPDLHPRLQVIPFQHIFRLLDDEDLDMIIGFKEPPIQSHQSALLGTHSNSPDLCLSRKPSSRP